MRIDSSNVGMESARSYRASNTLVRRFSITDYQSSLNNAVTSGQTGSQASKEEETENTPERKFYTVEDWRSDLRFSPGRVNFRRSRSEGFMDDFRQTTISYIFDMLFAGRRSRWSKWTDQGGSGSSINADSPSMRVLSFTEEQTFFEQEDTAFSAAGTVRTADGREINFNVNVGMSRRFQEVFRDELQLGAFNMCDPLVINLDTDVAELSDQKFYFDIDADGQLDEISQLGSKSGYLALDENGDGIINDGSELFGTASGDGFADLAKYDDDGNGWIDENDAIWSKLQIWCKEADGRDVLYRLADKGVGAICLQRAATDFTLQGAQGQTNGAIRSTGVFLYENGNVGTVQHVDVARYEQGA